MPKLADQLQIGAQLQLRNRVVMASLTRGRCPHAVPDALTERYYAERAQSAGLILSEGCLITAQGTRFLCWKFISKFYN